MLFLNCHFFQINWNSWRVTWYREKHKNAGIVIYYSCAHKQGLKSLSSFFPSVKLNTIHSTFQDFSDEMASHIWKPQRNVAQENHQISLNLIFLKKYFTVKSCNLYMQRIFKLFRDCTLVREIKPKGTRL